MQIKRDDQSIIVTANEDGSEIHPYITTLAAIEAQQRIIPPLVPRLNSHGWDTVKEALNAAILMIATAEDLPIIESDPIDPDTIIADDNTNSVSAVVDKVTGRKPQKPIYKSA